MPLTVRELALKVKAERQKAKIHRRCARETTKRLESEIEHIRTELAACLKKDEYDARHQPLEDRLTVATSRIDKNEARGQGIGTFWGWIIGGIGTIAAIGTWIAMLSGHK